MTSSSTPGRGRPARLDRAGTVDTALELLDELGLDALTMRRLADRLGVQAGALYRHFTTKQDLLTAMAERMLGDIRTPPGAPADWAGHLRALARAMRRALLARRDGARVFGGTHSVGPHTLGFAESVLGVLREAGFTDEDAARTCMTLVNFTLGHTLEEQAASAPSEGGSPVDADRLRNAVLAGPYPHLTAAMPVLTSTDFDAHFAFALDIQIAGLRHLRSHAE
ncbi:TetR/AcrR family transcriptional regulator [Streptomyces kunmingensis]|uniref:TetR/AcrR family transcriptional regulator n=1 Tax=Streptomyces kunmingensis TaxID=68225 RepID=A0ABU6C409_9ACTN|nr:TetR/AcrR family transcriptional regulator [Streptomyces kunmingensis]MEB3958831.1 TetR/AcrR family transcriptional regulator [Streptomyces kunmingensis]